MCWCHVCLVSCTLSALDWRWSQPVKRPSWFLVSILLVFTLCWFLFHLGFTDIRYISAAHYGHVIITSSNPIRQIPAGVVVLLFRDNHHPFQSRFFWESYYTACIPARRFLKIWTQGQCIIWFYRCSGFLKQSNICTNLIQPVYLQNYKHVKIHKIRRSSYSRCV